MDLEINILETEHAPRERGQLLAQLFPKPDFST